MERILKFEELTRALKIEQSKVRLYEKLCDDALNELKDWNLVIGWGDKLNISALRVNQICNQIQNL